MPKEIVKHAVKTAFIMIIFTIVGTAMLAYIYNLTKTPIAESEAKARMALFRQIVPDNMHDNELLQDVIEIPANEMLGNKFASHVYRARLDGKPMAVILEAIAPDGYSGDIKLLVAIRVDGTIAGVRVLAHKETPGLGDYIDITHSAWIKQFDGHSLSSRAAELWKVKKDGGQFDYMVGATITPRAVIKAVHKVLEYYEIHRESLFAVAVTKNEPTTAVAGAAS
ncbi:MAG: electron transport complex subunit RsxG [Betaproteobacteria bacterium HGW-Betaproteobacteria-8]|nr:MAG: electron transport complex subunit RsxG [Betaproteobacteria bacterium HGW-Betaproteobacteria-8]